MEIIPHSGNFKLILLYLSFFILSCSTVPWQRAARSGDTEAQVMADIGYLADDKLEGRAFGTKGEMKASGYIAKRFDLLGLQPKGENGTWFQSFTVKKANPHKVEFDSTVTLGSQTGRNVIAYLDHKASMTMIIGAHYDHLGMGASGSLYMGPPAIHNGADDNASGVAMILELAERLRNVKKFNYLFIAFTGEENGLWGSNYYCDHPTLDMKSVTAMLNFDMVGRLNRDTRKMIINGVGTSPVWTGAIKSANAGGLNLTTSESGIGPSDHTSFYLEDMPVLHFFTGAHEDYHKPSDDVHLINAEGIDVIAGMVVSLIQQLDSQAKLPFTKTKDPDPSTTPSMEVTLGILPDYLYDGTGVRVDGVREGKPAEVAGIIKGDVIVKLSGTDLKDIYAYMKVLSTFHKGDKTTVDILRGEKEMHFDIQF
ncbi:MAG TPA: M28 family peptidase [Saprospiraceae bacterium]|nr:M28 family peptidase [Saprospiraceae bacterium]